MRSILAKILVWSLMTYLLSIVAYKGIHWSQEHKGPRENDPFWRMTRLIEENVCKAYENGGPQGLAKHLEEIDNKLPGKHYLTNRRGIDLVTGEDRSEWLRNDRMRSGPRQLADGRIVLIGRPYGNRYRFITLADPWFGPPNFLPYYAAIVFMIVGMGSILALHLAAPIRKLQKVVERFGSGDLAARTESKRMDEIGELSRAFDEMAVRIETLLSAERRLLQDVSHELRSPLARLGFAIELAQDGQDHERAEALGRVRKEANRMTMLVSELLQLTRLEGDPSAVVRKVVRIDQLLDEVAGDCDLEAEARDVEIDLQIERAVTLNGEAELLRRAFENITRNAIRHAPPKTRVELRLSLRESDVTVSIRDHGPGVPEDYIEKIFRPFFRVDDDRSRASGGVGLGLAIAHRAIGLHQGRIQAVNASPGLLVTITLPHATTVTTHDPGINSEVEANVEAVTGT